MVMIPTCKAKNQDTAVKLLGDAILLLAKIEETCKNRDHALIVKKICIFKSCRRRVFYTS